MLAGAVSSGSAALSSAPSRQPTRGKPALPDWRSPVYTLVAAQMAAYLLFNVLALTPPTALGLSLRSPQWWQGLTSGFAFTGWQHLAESVFLTYIFGRLLERAHGAWGLWLAFLASVLGANAFAAWLLPAKLLAPCFATSAAVFGLFVCGLLLPRLNAKPLEVLCLAPFVATMAVERYSTLTTHVIVEGIKVGHLVHVAGAFVGACVAWVILLALEAYRRKVEQEKEDRERAAKAQQQQEQAKAVAQALGTAAKAATDIAKKLI